MTIKDEQPPVSTNIDLSEYLTRMFDDARIEDSRARQYPVLTVIPSKLSIGKTYYFDAVILPDITQIGFWGYTSVGWVLLG